MASDGAENLASFIKTAITSSLKDLHTCIPGIVEKFDPVKQVLEVQPAISRIYVGDNVQPLPKLLNVPLITPQTAKMSITLPVKKGDECLILFSERSIDLWLKEGKVSPPNDFRFHDLSDGFALLGVSSNPKAISNYDPDNIQIRNEDASVSVTIKPTDEIELKAPVKVLVDSPLLECTGDVKDSVGTLAELRAKYNAATYIGNLGSPTSTTSMPDP